MKNNSVSAPFALAIAAVIAAPADAHEVLTGDTRLACEATLCLAAGTRPNECSPSLSRYFSIHKRKWSDTVRARANFLSLCPVSDQTPEMRSLVSAMANGAGAHERVVEGVVDELGDALPRLELDVPQHAEQSRVRGNVDARRHDAAAQRWEGSR
jgi:hypothetical protein